MSKLAFAPEDLELFSGASRDRNPLHVSALYAHTTPFGEPVVFGILAALAVLGRTRDRHRNSLRSVDLEFRHALHLGIDYRLELDEGAADETTARIFDDRQLMMKARFVFADGAAPHKAQISEIETRSHAADLRPGDLEVGQSVDGMYGPSAAPFKKLIDSYRLLAKGVTQHQIAALLWSSYLVGMELPGKRALFWRLSMEFNEGSDECGTTFSYDARVRAYSERMGVVEIEAHLGCATNPLTRARIRSFLRRDPPVPSAAAVSEHLQPSERLRNKVALVIGGSRGLGASICQALALQGCTVLLNYRRSDEDAESIQSSVAGVSGRIELFRGDATDVGWCERARAEVLATAGGLDFLICSATPPIRPLGFGLESVKRLQDFVAVSTAMVTVPMAAFLDAVASRAGWCVAISSSYVKTLEAEWPHYIMAKCAVEGLVHWAAARHPNTKFLLARPPRLMTAQTNTPAGRIGAVMPEVVAAAIIRRMCEQVSLDRAVEYMDCFPAEDDPAHCESAVALVSSMTGNVRQEFAS